MDIYQSEEEQVEAIKRWWRENGRSVIAGVVIALAIVGGWRGWTAYKSQQSEAASATYMRMVSAVESGATERAREQGSALIREFGSTPYGPLAALYLAKLSVENGKLEEAERHLRWTMENAALPEVTDVARVRLARVLSQRGEHDAALELLSGDAPAGFQGPYAEARGDILLTMGETDEARRDYRKALTAYNGSPQKRSLLQMKLDDLAGAEGQ